MKTKKIKKIALFFNSDRGLEVFKSLKNDYLISVFLSKKNLRHKIPLFLKKKQIYFKLLKKISKKLPIEIKKKKIDLLISAGYPLIFSKKLLLSTKYGAINLHAGPLPKYRGGSPLNWQIINNEKYIEINVIKMVEKIDAGPIYDSCKFKIEQSDDIQTIHHKVNKIFPKLVKKSIEKIEKNIPPTKQKNKKFKICKQRTEADGLIDWERKDAKQVYNFVRAITKPYPGAYYFENNIKKRIYKCKISKNNPKIKAGTIFFYKKNKFIKCKKFSIKLEY